MAREAMVRRTIKTTTLKLKVFDPVIDQMLELNRTYTRVPSNAEKAHKYVQKHIDSGLRVLKIMAREDKEVKYGMPENDFIMIAKDLSTVEETETPKLNKEDQEDAE